MTSHGQPDEARSSRYILKDYVSVSCEGMLAYSAMLSQHTCSTVLSQHTCSVHYCLCGYRLYRTD